MKNSNKSLRIIIILLVLCTFVSISYAYFKVSDSQNNANSQVIVNAPSCASVSFSSSSSINIQPPNSVPISDAKVLSATTFRTPFVVKNNCTKAQNISIILVPQSSSTMPVKALKYALIEQSAAVPSSGTNISSQINLSSSTQKELRNKSTSYNGVTSGYLLGEVSVPASSSKSYYLYVWIDENEGGLGDGSTMNKKLLSTIVIGTGVSDDFGDRVYTLYETIENRYKNNDTYVKLYSESDASTYANPVYYFNGAVTNNNVLFGGFCWKMVRTTDTGGVKMVYNGVQTNGSCNNTGAATQIGTSAFNSNLNSPAYVGYMYNTVYPVSSKSMSTISNIVFGNFVIYANGKYGLNNTKTVEAWSSGYNTINSTHYTCFTTGSTCEEVYYVYYTTSTYAYYITLTDGKRVDDALNEMLYADDVNTKDSTIKAYIDSWYKENMTSYTDKLEDTVFCNDRTILNKNGWDSVTGSTTTYLYFKNNSTNYSLACTNETDRFSVSNSKAKLTYPVGLLSAPEVYLAYRNASSNTYYLKTGNLYWLASPDYFDSNFAYGRRVDFSGYMNGYLVVDDAGGVRPVVSLKPGTVYDSGDGTYTNPFVIE